MPCCPTSCPPIPTPFLIIDGAYPQVDAPMYAIYDSVRKGYIAPVFLDNPGPCVNPAPGIVTVGAKTVHVFYARNAENNRIKTVYDCSPGLPTVQLQNCRPRACATSREQFERSKLAAIAVTAQNGTYCKSPMSSSELLQYQKAMNSVKDLHVINNCC